LLLKVLDGPMELGGDVYFGGGCGFSLVHFCSFC